MARRQRRQSQNSQYMRQILVRLREFDLEEVDMLCRRYREEQAAGGGRGARRGKGQPS